MSKLIPMDEAAQILGMTVEQLSELRSNNEIFGYKDGSNWKFKMSELERVAEELNITLNVSSDAAKVADDLSDSLGFDLSDSEELYDEDDSASLIEDLDSNDYIEDSSVELDQPNDDDGFIISDDESGINLGDDSGEIRLAGPDDLDHGTSSTNFELGSDASVLDDDDEQLSFGSSSLSLAAESSQQLLDENQQAMNTGQLLSQGDDFELPEDDFTFTDSSSSFEDSAELSGDFEDSGGLILEDSDSSNEIKLADDSDIRLSPSDSGLALGENAGDSLALSAGDSLALDGSAGDSLALDGSAGDSLALDGSAGDSLSLSGDIENMIVVDEPSGADSATMLPADEFDLTPLEPALDEDDSSSSQVIALEDSEIYADDSAATILGGDASAGYMGAAGMGMGAPTDQSAGFGAAAAYNQGMAPQPETFQDFGQPVGLPEAPYSLFQVLALGTVASLMAVGSMVAFNLAQNLWMADDQTLQSSVAGFFINMITG